jgi:hypothetical protein
MESTVELPPLWTSFASIIHLNFQLVWHTNPPWPVKVSLLENKKLNLKCWMGFAYSWVPKPSHGAFSLNKKKCQWCGSSLVRWSSFQFSPEQICTSVGSAYCRVKVPWNCMYSSMRFHGARVLHLCHAIFPRWVFLAWILGLVNH